MTLAETSIRIEYFHQASDEYLRRLGVDRVRLPSPEEWHLFYESDYARPLPERESYGVLWEIDGETVGFSSVDQIVFGRDAFMHLHVLDETNRRQGLGSRFIRMTAHHYLDVLQLERVFSQPNAFNTAPNRALQSAGFRYLSTREITPGPINFPQPVTRWVFEKEIGTLDPAYGGPGRT